ncbi:MAG: AAA family ATPase, partial [Kiritimatiellae bacterium]|nr:AAA family ATPase [Kiritimatiellia bacterium]
SHSPHEGSVPSHSLLHLTLIFLDEIQECRNARTAFKFPARDGRYDVVASGSLLWIK